MSPRASCVGAVLCLVSSAWPASGQGAPTARIIGIYESSSGQPVAGAEVRDLFTGTFALTTQTGTASLAFVTYRGQAGLIEIRKIGYTPVQVMLDRADTTGITQLLDRIVELPAMETKATYNLNTDAGALAGFELRCSAKRVSCYDAPEMAARPTWTITDFILKAHGVESVCRLPPRGTSTPTCIAKMHSSTGRGMCTPTYYVDGFAWAPVGVNAQGFLSESFDSKSIRGIEIYLAGLPRPLRFEGDSHCGAIVVWTK